MTCITNIMKQYFRKEIALLAILVLSFSVLTALKLVHITPPAGEVKYPPVSTFESSCARCHGPQGSFYGASFGKLPEAKLKKFVHDMMKGPAGLHPDPADIAAMTAYNQALASEKPFVFTAKPDTLNGVVQFSGEVIPGTSLMMISGSDTLHVDVNDQGMWEAQPVDKSQNAGFLAIYKKDTLLLNPALSQWTNDYK